MAHNSTNVLNVLKHTVKTAYGEAASTNLITRYGKYITIALLILLASSATYFGYGWYVSYREQYAQKILSDYLTDYYVAAQNNTPEGWAQTGVLFKMGAQQNSSSYLAPYFDAFYAETLIKQGKKEDAIAAMHDVIQKMPSSSPFLNLFKLKYALMRMDAADEATVQAGLNDLVSIGRDKNNMQRDAALFYLGQYYMSIDRVEDARLAWQELAESYRQDHIARSPWASLVEEKLQQLHV